MKSLSSQAGLEWDRLYHGFFNEATVNGQRVGVERVKKNGAGKKNIQGNAHNRLKLCFDTTNNTNLTNAMGIYSNLTFGPHLLHSLAHCHSMLTM